MEMGNSIEILIIYLLSTSVIAAFIYLIKWKLNRQHLYKLAANIPTVEGMRMLPFVGHGAFALDSVENMAFLRLLCNKLTPPRTLWLWYKLFFVVNRAEDVQVILNTCLSKDDLYKMTEKSGGSGLISLPVPTWKRHRKTIMPTFNQRVLDKFVEIFAAQAEIFVKQLENKTGQIIDISDNLSKYFLDTISEAAMGVKPNSQTTMSTIEQAIKRLMEIVMMRIVFPPYHVEWIYKFSSMCREERKYADIFHKFIMNVIKTKLNEYRKEATEQDDFIKSKEKERFVFLELLIELSEKGENWTLQEIKDEVSTFMIAGSDSSATISGFAKLLLGMHPEVQQKCYEEVMEVLGPVRQPEYTDLPRLIYLEKVIKETMRLFPIGPIILRKIDEDIEVGGYTLPKGAGVIIFILSMHYSEIYYKDAWKFDPERFSPEEVAKRHKYAYIPFSAGPRNCIGQKYAMMSLKTFFAFILRKFRIETTYKNIKDIRIRQSIVIAPVEGFPVRLFSRS